MIIIAIFLGFGYYKYTSKTVNNSNSVNASTRQLMDKMKKMLEDEKNRLKNEAIVKKIDENQTEKNVKKVTQKIIIKPKNIKKENIVKSNYLSEVKDFEKSSKYTKKTEEKNITQKVIKYSGKPKLAIIIDDVSFLSQVKKIQEIPFKVTPSFFPPTKRHPDTIELSHKFKFAMIHLPLEAMHFANAEPETLLASDSQSTIAKRIDEIKKEFPQIKYYNNHTGSKFTSNLKAMQRLITVMQSENLHFVDSRTSADTKAHEVFNALHLKLLSRDVFLDNTIVPAAILSQLKKAVQIAEKNGYAIAIGHPHKNTLNVLKKAKPFLKDVQLVYINEL